MSYQSEQIGNNTTVISFPWPQKDALPDGLPEVMKFDYELLPVKLRPYIENSAKALQCPPDFLAVTVMVSLASLIGRNVAIRPKVNEQWQVVPNLWGANVGEPSTKKSPAQNKATQPLRDLDSAAWDAHQQELQQQSALEHMRDAEIKALKTQLCQYYRKPNDDINPEEVSKKIAGLEAESESSKLRRYITQDATIEKLAELLSENELGMLLLRDELMGWLRQMDRDGHEGDRGFYLESWDGNGSCYTDRIGRGTTRCEALCLSIHGGIQPGPLRAYVRDAMGNGSRADGLLQRFQLIVWPDAVGDWKYVDELINPGTYNLAFSVFHHLNEMTPESIGAVIPEHGLPYQHFDAEAQELYIQWATELNTVKIPNCEHSAIGSHLSKYESLMPSLALLLHLADGFTGPVSRDAAAKAADWCEYLESHARRVYSACVNGDIHAAILLATKIKSGSITNGSKVRDLYQKKWSGLDRKACKEALAVLEDYGWVRVEKTDTGGRPSEVVMIHPDLRGKSNG